MRRGGVKSFVDDLVLGRGVVISRAATSLRSVETQPLTRRFVRIQTNDISARVKCFESINGWYSPAVAVAPSPCLLSLSVYVFYVFECLCVSLCVGVSPTNSRDVCVFFRVSHSASVSRVGFGQQVRTLPRAYLIQLGQAYFGNKCVICPETHTDRPNVLSVDVDVLFF